MVYVWRRASVRRVTGTGWGQRGAHPVFRRSERAFWGSEGAKLCGGGWGLVKCTAEWGGRGAVVWAPSASRVGCARSNTLGATCRQASKRWPPQSTARVEVAQELHDLTADRFALMQFPRQHDGHV